ncbi:Acetyltransferase (isoleucine patch superfamily) [Fulvivirga imtechensis AK7]|uniref:Acetyltransferase (Isoleucine patch superfamily) n=1 Tax=Fulvivirga imtechensis AK7 TaxID=1237149 RepID=L8JTF0_9BACT|nr:acetyltransferase [Fulvivirga imtechensis]ELR70617.1 Acetyltransferase (isoleucine patch superfamily) [Fulvivirga imtechensis AK7]
MRKYVTIENQMYMKKIAIYGAGGLGKEVKTIIDAINQAKPVYDFLGYFDDNVRGDHVIGGLADLNRWEENIHLVIGIGAPEVKEQIISSITNSFIRYETLIHPGAEIGNGDDVQIGVGTIVTAGCILTTDIEIGKHVLLNLNTTIGHDVVIGDFCSIMPGVNLAGAVKIKKSVLIGSGANIINAVCIGERAVVGAGAVVLKNVKSHSTVVGVPAREL